MPAVPVLVRLPDSVTTYIDLWAARENALAAGRPDLRRQGKPPRATRADFVRAAVLAEIARRTKRDRARHSLPSKKGARNHSAPSSPKAPAPRMTAPPHRRAHHA